jgi:hypothetical protein
LWFHHTLNPRKAGYSSQESTSSKNGLSESKNGAQVIPMKNGKGVFFEVIQALVGEDNGSQVSLSRFSNPFALYSPLGKWAILDLNQ